MANWRWPDGLGPEVLWCFSVPWAPKDWFKQRPRSTSVGGKRFDLGGTEHFVAMFEGGDRFESFDMQDVEREILEAVAQQSTSFPLAWAETQVGMRYERILRLGGSHYQTDYVRRVLGILTVAGHVAEISVHDSVGPKSPLVIEAVQSESGATAYLVVMPYRLGDEEEETFDFESEMASYGVPGRLKKEFDEAVEPVLGKAAQ